MDLKNVAAVSGKPGLYKVIKPTRTGVILETLDETGKRWVANAAHRVSILREISVYVTGEESSILLEDLYTSIKEKYGEELPVTPKDSTNKLEGFLAEILPDFDKERVYSSDIKKMISWYNIISKFAPEFFEATATENEEVPSNKEETKN